MRDRCSSRRQRAATRSAGLSDAALPRAHAAPTAVADAAMQGNRDAVRTLLKQGADVNAAQGDGMTALHWAAQKGDAELAQRCCSHAGANVRATTRIGGYTPLHPGGRRTAARAVIEALLKAGADAERADRRTARRR